MIKPIAFALTLLCSLSGFGQNLSQQLWQRSQNCHSMFEDMDDDGHVDYDEIVDDSKNGYLYISGTWPACGCGCSSTVAAYKSTKGDYTFIEKESWNCSWQYHVSSNKNLDAILPKQLLNKFFSEPIENYENQAMFYLNIDIPQIGTDTKIYLLPIPFGLHIKSNNVITYAIGESEGYANCKSLHGIKNIVANMQDKQTLTYLTNNEFEKIGEHDIQLINNSIGNDDSRFNSKSDLLVNLKSIEKVYKAYLQIAHEYIVLGWDRTNARFYIKETGNQVEKISFEAFLLKFEYWQAMC